MRSARNPATTALAIRLAAPAAAQQSDDELAAEATDPTASPMSFRLYDWYQASFRDASGNQEWVLRAGIPLPLPR